MEIFVPWVLPPAAFFVSPPVPVLHPYTIHTASMPLGYSAHATKTRPEGAFLASFEVLGTYLALDNGSALLSNWSGRAYNMSQLVPICQFARLFLSLVSSAFDSITSSYWPIAPVGDNTPVKQSANGRRKKGRVQPVGFSARPFLLLSLRNYPTPTHYPSTQCTREPPAS
jgi:hypothetical protein